MAGPNKPRLDLCVSRGSLSKFSEEKQAKCANWCGDIAQGAVTSLIDSSQLVNHSGLDLTA